MGGIDEATGANGQRARGWGDELVAMQMLAKTEARRKPRRSTTTEETGADSPANLTPEPGTPTADGRRGARRRRFSAEATSASGQLAVGESADEAAARASASTAPLVPPPPPVLVADVSTAPATPLADS